MSEVRGGWEVPNSKDLDLIPGDIVPQTHSKGCAFVGLVEFLVGD